MGTSDYKAQECKSIRGESVIIRRATENDLAPAQALLGASYDLADVDYRDCVVAEEQDPVAQRRRIVGVGLRALERDGRLSRFEIFTESDQPFIARYIVRQQLERGDRPARALT
jgi:hypothetical protein